MAEGIDDPALNKIIIAILLKRLGGTAVIQQRDIDEVRAGRIIEDLRRGVFTLRYSEKTEH